MSFSFVGKDISSLSFLLSLFEAVGFQSQADELPVGKLVSYLHFLIRANIFFYLTVIDPPVSVPRNAKEEYL